MAKSLSVHPNSTVAGLVLIRLFLGAFFLAAGILQLMQVNVFAEVVRQSAAPGGVLVAGNRLAPVSAALVRVVAPHGRAVAWGIIVLMLVVGALLLVGLCTRLVGMMALGMTMVYLLATWHIPAGLLEIEPLGAGLALLAMEFTVVASAAGRTFGLDAAVAKKSKNKLFW